MKIFTLLFVFLVLSFSLSYSQDMRAKKISSAYEDGSSYVVNNIGVPVPFILNPINPSGTIPTMVTFADYVTNGNNLRKVWVLGDTVIATGDYLDSMAALNTRTIRYNVSFDGGATWGTTPLIVSEVDNQAYGCINRVFTTTPTVTVSGRQYAPGSRAFAGVDLVMGLGNFDYTLNPATGQDYFSRILSSTELGGVYRSGDSLFYEKYDFINKTFSSTVFVAASPDFDASGRLSCDIASNGQNVFAVGYLSASPEKIFGRESTNGGTSFGPLTTITPDVAVVNGDSTMPWPSFDVIYKPGTTQKCVAWQTLYPGNFITRRGCKILFWSPTINSGNPVIVADWRDTAVTLLNDSLLFETAPHNYQINMSPLCHPSLAYTDNGSRLICTFLGAQRDTSSYGFQYFDVFAAYSDDDGATWSDARNLTHTSSLDEIYVSLSKTGNLQTNVGMVFQVSECPGSSSFNQTPPTTPQCPVYWVYRRYDPVTGAQLPIGVKTISNEIPKTYSLAQNYPNPFNPSTKIKFNMPKNGLVTLKVYDMLGRVVSTLVNNEFVTAGEKEVTFAGQNLASGIYFYHIEAGEFTATRKMTLVK